MQQKQGTRTAAVRSLPSLALRYDACTESRASCSIRTAESLNQPACFSCCPPASLVHAYTLLVVCHSSGLEGMIPCRPSPSTCRPFPTRGGRYTRTPSPSSSVVQGTAAPLCLCLPRPPRTKASPREWSRGRPHQGKLNCGTFR